MQKQLTQKEQNFWPNNRIYFLTDSCYLHYPYFEDDEKKEIVLAQIKKIQTDLKVPVLDYSIAMNHYHLQVFLDDGLKLKKVKQLLRGGVSYMYRKRYEMKYADMWSSWKTIVVYKESARQKISGYIIGNLLKHRECSTYKELLGCDYSSFKYKVERYGFDVAKDMVETVIDVGEDEYGGIDIDNLIKL